MTTVTQRQPSPPSVTTLSADEARRMALRAQGLLGAPGRRGATAARSASARGSGRPDGVRGMLRGLGAVQLDTISVLARSHELVPYARLGAVGRAAVESAYWSASPADGSPARPHSFEYWSHAACILPIEEWPHFAFRRRARRAKGHRWHVMKDSARSCAAVLDRLKADGPLTTSQLGGGRNGGEWWDWSETKIAVEWLLDTGEVVCTERRGWKRVYDLAERAVPAPLLHDDLDDTECIRRLVAQAGAAMGVATRADLADYHRLKGEQVDAVIEGTGLVPVAVEGWSKPAWADPEALAAPPRGRHRTTLLSPFDSLIWDRPRTERIFDFTHRLEAYVPKSRRIHGYFAMPLLAGGKLMGRVDPAREGATLVARQLSLHGPKAVGPMAQALREAATWVGCDSVRVERCDDPRLAAALQTELTRTDEPDTGTAESARQGTAD
ncbi:winged helix-turn-helix domain-containing protein [Streptomyces sp. NPDC093097]|uniref:winged helix-turn-helix domain-containing protein n=1 Tax=Streptomyces sp. NPDC093097 TaxID=3366027 RepID=UPI00380B11FE